MNYKILPPKLCACGCGGFAKIGNKYIHGHNGRGHGSFSEFARARIRERCANKNVEVICAECGIKLTRQLNQTKRKDGTSKTNHFCSKKCLGKFNGKIRVGSNHPMWIDAKKEFICKECGKHFVDYPSNRKKSNVNGLFCCRECHDSWRSKNYFGDRCPNWRGGLSYQEYCSAWKDKEYKRDIMERDGNKCLNPTCQSNESRLVLHHINYDKKNCGPTNLITVCNSCNSVANYNREWWKSFYAALIHRRYGCVSVESIRQAV